MILTQDEINAVLHAIGEGWTGPNKHLISAIEKLEDQLLDTVECSFPGLPPYTVSKVDPNAQTQ